MKKKISTASLMAGYGTEYDRRTMNVQYKGTVMHHRTLYTTVHVDYCKTKEGLKFFMDPLELRNAPF